MPQVQGRGGAWEGRQRSEQHRLVAGREQQASNGWQRAAQRRAAQIVLQPPPAHQTVAATFNLLKTCYSPPGLRPRARHRPKRRPDSPRQRLVTPDRASEVSKAL